MFTRDMVNQHQHIIDTMSTLAESMIEQLCLPYACESYMKLKLKHESVAHLYGFRLLIHYFGVT